MTPTRRSWLLRRPDPNAQARIFCLPYSGTGASSFARWPTHLDGGQIEICPIQPPGRENRIAEPYVESFEELAHELSTDLAPYTDRPYALFGHCSAALAAYATTVEILSTPEIGRPATLVVSAQVAPHHGPVSRYFELDREELHAEVSSLIRDLGDMPDDDTVDLAVETLQNDIELHRRYHIDHPQTLGLPITVIGWNRDAEVPPATQHGWGELATACNLRFRTLPGDHFTVLDPPKALFDEIAAAAWGETQ